jgi:hypothetical protein
MDDIRGSNPPPPPKKRVRKVSNTSQDQLRAKRDQDREAQRAFRERSRLRIPALEQELAIMRANQHNHNGVGLEAIANLQRENRKLKDQLRRIHKISLQRDNKIGHHIPTDHVNTHLVRQPIPKQTEIPFKEFISLGSPGYQHDQSPRQDQANHLDWDLSSQEISFAQKPSKLVLARHEQQEQSVKVHLASEHARFEIDGIGNSQNTSLPPQCHLRTKTAILTLENMAATVRNPQLVFRAGD